MGRRLDESRTMSYENAHVCTALYSWLTPFPGIVAGSGLPLCVTLGELSRLDHRPLDHRPLRLSRDASLAVHAVNPVTGQGEPRSAGPDYSVLSRPLAGEPVGTPAELQGPGKPTLRSTKSHGKRH